MSRIGKQPVTIPAKVTVSADGNRIAVEGPKGKLEKTFAGAIKIEVEDGSVVVTREEESRFTRSMHGTARSIIAGMVEGVVNGFEKDLEINGVGFRAHLEGSKLALNLGYSHTIEYPVPEGIDLTVTDQTKIKVAGVDKQLVGAVAADIKHFYKPEPYKGKGVRIVGEYVRRKEGKTVG